MQTKIALIALATLVGSTSLVSAHDPYRPGGYNIDRRQAIQDHRIEQGRRTGELTRLEAWRLRQEQARIAEMERRAKADGVVTYRERQVIKRAQDDASRHIYQESHDGQKSWWRRWRHRHGS